MNNIPQDNTQVNSQQDNPDETAAVLAFATNLSEQSMPKPEQPQAQETEATSEPSQQEEVDIQEEREPEVDLGEEVGKIVDSKLEDFKKEMDGEKEKPEKKEEKNDLKEFKNDIEKTIKDKFDKLTKTLTDALK